MAQETGDQTSGSWVLLSNQNFNGTKVDAAHLDLSSSERRGDFGETVQQEVSCLNSLPKVQLYQTTLVYIYPWLVPAVFEKCWQLRWPLTASSDVLNVVYSAPFYF